MRDWTADDSPAPLTADELLEASAQFYALGQRIRRADPAALAALAARGLAPPEPAPEPPGKKKRGK